MNIDNNTNNNNNNDRNNRNKNNNNTNTSSSVPLNYSRYAPLLPLLLGIAIKIFGVLWLALGIRTLFVVFLLAGLSVFLYWAYKNGTINKYKYTMAAKSAEKACICKICNHDEAKMCMQKKCPCCLMMKKDIIIGHSNNSLQ